MSRVHVHCTCIKDEYLHMYLVRGHLRYVIQYKKRKELTLSLKMSTAQEYKKWLYQSEFTY